jgi:hypothetical protein
MAAQMRHRPVIPAAERVAIGIAIFARHMGMTIGIVIVGIRVVMMIEIPAGCFNALVKSTPLDIAKLLRGLVPAILRSHGRGLSIRSGSIRLQHSRAGNSQRESKYR